MSLWMATHGLAVVPPIKFRADTAEAQQSPQRERRKGMFSLSDFSGFAC